MLNLGNKLKKTVSVKGGSSRKDFHNLLIFGDNLNAMSMLINKHDLRGRVNLVYIDPPFATGSDFVVGENRVSTISKSLADPIAYSDRLLGEEFLLFLKERLILLRELMADNASIYLHIDYKIGHYVKIVMDEVFGIENFKNDITRIKCNPKNFQRNAYGNIKDMILFYTKGPGSVWHNPTMDFSDSDKKRLFKKTDSEGRKYTTIPLHAPGETKNGATGMPWRGVMPPAGRHWRSSPAVLEDLDKEGLIEWSKTGVPRKKIYEDDRKGKKAQDIWDFKDPQYPSYPTEKNIDLLKFIINSSSNEGDIVLDCFSGSGTTILAAQMLDRKWIGIDGSEHAIRISEERLHALSPTLFNASSEHKKVILK